jgi:hypothetical protein
MSHEDPQVLSYGPPWATRPSVLRAMGVSGVVVGCLELLGNAFVAAAMFGQLLKQGTGRGAVSRAFEPWLITTGAEAALSAALAGFAIVAGAAMLYRSRVGIISLRWFAWAKLPFALFFSVWAGWAMKLFVSSNPVEVAAAAMVALLCSAAYPVYVLRLFSGVRARASPRGVHA